MVMVDYALAVQAVCGRYQPSLFLRPGKIQMGNPGGGRLSRDVWEVERKPPDSCFPHCLCRKRPVCLSSSLSPSFLSFSASFLPCAWRGHSPPCPQGIWTSQASRTPQQSMFKTKWRDSGGQSYIPHELRPARAWSVSHIFFTG